MISSLIVVGSIAVMPVFKMSSSEAFKVLEMEEGGNEDEIKRKYKQLALKW